MRRKQINRKELAVIYQAHASDRVTCPLKPRCTQAAQRTLTRHMSEDALSACMLAPRLRLCGFDDQPLSIPSAHSNTAYSDTRGSCYVV